MSYHNKYLVIIGICLNLTYFFDMLEQNGNINTIIPQLIMVAFVNISVVTAFFSKKWFGQLLLYANFLLVGLIPLFLGIVSIWITNEKFKTALKYACACIPLVLLFLPIIAHMKGSITNNWEPSLKFVLYRLVQAIYWYAVFVYTSTHLKQEYEKIEKNA